MEGPKFTSIKDAPKKSKPLPDDLIQSYNDNEMQLRYQQTHGAGLGWHMQNEQYGSVGNTRIYLWKSFQMGEKKFLQFGVELNGKCEISMSEWDGKERSYTVDKVPFKLNYDGIEWGDYWHDDNKKRQKEDAKRFDKVVKHAKKNWSKYAKKFK
jgi:hypothetical protein